MFRRILASLLILVCATSVFAASPRLSGISPRGVQRGTETVLTFSGSTLGDGEQILFYSPGFEVVKVETIDANNCKATVKISPDCRLGEHVAQVRTKTGISDYRTFYIGTSRKSTRRSRITFLTSRNRSLSTKPLSVRLVVRMSITTSSRRRKGNGFAPKSRLCDLGLRSSIPMSPFST